MKIITMSIILSFLMISCNKVDIPSSISKAQDLIKEGKYKEAEELITPCLDAAKNNPVVRKDGKVVITDKT